MIASLAGVALHVMLDRAVIDVNGVGYLVYATPGTLAGLRVGQGVNVATSMVVREDSMTLYGFADHEERDVFEAVLTVSGVGPRLALAMLAVHTPETLRRIMATEDSAALTQVPGIGKKGAQRILLELGDRLGPPAGHVARAVSGAPSMDSAAGQVIDALIGLGWPTQAAEDALAHVLADADTHTVAPQDVAPTLRQALRVLGGSRG